MIFAWTSSSCCAHITIEWAVTICIASESIDWYTMVCMFFSYMVYNALPDWFIFIQTFSEIRRQCQTGQVEVELCACAEASHPRWTRVDTATHRLIKDTRVALTPPSRPYWGERRRMTGEGWSLTDMGGKGWSWEKMGLQGKENVGKGKGRCGGGGRFSRETLSFSLSHSTRGKLRNY